MSSIETTQDIIDLQAPYGKELKLQTVTFEGGLELFRIRIKEGKRFTMLDLDPDTASNLVEQLAKWQNEVHG